MTYIAAYRTLAYSSILCTKLSRGSHIIEDDQRSVDASDGVVTDTGLDAGHPGVDDIGHGGQIKMLHRHSAIAKGRMGVKQRWDEPGGWPKLSGAQAVTWHVMTKGLQLTIPSSYILL